jgi:membrane protease YdiL (CAAX protease family)
METQVGPSSPDRFAARLRGFGLIGILSILVIVGGNLIVIPLSGISVLIWRRWSHTAWHEIGYVRPKSWFRTLFFGLAFGIIFKLLMKIIVMPLLGADPINQAYHYLAGNSSVLPGMLFAVIIGAGFGEETVFRGYMFERLGKLLGVGVGAKLAIVLITAVWFGVVHYPDQGLSGAEQATIFGLVFGIIFAFTGQIWLLMVAHAAFDLTALAIIYFNLESYVSHLVFK